MATTKASGVRLAGIASAVPSSIITVAELASIFGRDEAYKISDSLGVQERHIVPNSMCTSDLCEAASRQLLTDLHWAADSVDVLIFVSQTPDYLLPATSCLLHGRLGLSDRCAAFDLNLGCSGYIYGLWLAAQLVMGGLQRVLLLVGDTSSRIVSPQDRSSAPLFGDAGTATAIERTSADGLWAFDLGTDGSGWSYLIVHAGGFRQPRTETTSIRTEREGGNVRSDEDLYMDGAEIFAFSLNRVPPLIKSVLEASNWTIESIDGLVMHQANRFMLQHLAKRLKLPANKLILCLERFGNTSSASIPLALTHVLAERLRVLPLNLVLAGFGVGLSWGAVALQCGPMIMPKLVIVDSKTD